MSPEERAQALLEAPPDGWLALSEDESRVVATGLSYPDVVEKAEALGVLDPVIIKIPPDWTTRIYRTCA